MLNAIEKFIKEANAKAQRRMVSLKVNDTDEFLDMSTSSRLLYYDLSMRADDDGFFPVHITISPSYTAA